MRFKLPLVVAGLALATTACNSSADRTDDAALNADQGGVLVEGDAPADSAGTNAVAGAVQSADAFVATVAASDMYEIESGRLAQSKASNATLKSFGSMLVADHTKSSTDLKAAASASSPALTPPPTLPAEQRAKIDALTAANGAEFDRLFLQQQREGHQKTLAALTAYAASGDQQPLKDFASKASPVVQRHLDELNKINL